MCNADSEQKIYRWDVFLLWLHNFIERFYTRFSYINTVNLSETQLTLYGFEQIIVT